MWQKTAHFRLLFAARHEIGNRRKTLVYRELGFWAYEILDCGLVPEEGIEPSRGVNPTGF
jgi:hypothetical protein